MGRKGNFLEKPKKGPGRKARKQAEPVFKFIKDDDDDRKLSHHQKQRLKKRELQETNKKQPQKKKLNLEKPAQKAKLASTKNSASDTVDPAEIFDLEKSRQKYKQLGRKNMQPSATSNGLKNGAAQNRVNLFESDNEDDEEMPQPKVGNGPTRASMKKFLQQDDSEEDDSDEEEMDSEDEDEEPVDGESDDEEEEDEDMDDDEDEDEDDDSDDNDDDDEEDADMLPIEAANKKLKKRMERDQKMADEEMAESAANRERFEFPSEEEVAQTTSLQDVNMRIRDVVGVLSDFSANRDSDHARCEYIDLLRKDLCMYYSYNEYLMNLLMDLFAPNELLEFLEASEIQRPTTIRANSLKTRRRDLAQALINRGINLDPIGKWSKDGLVIYSSQVPLGATPEYLAGFYMLQGGSSMLPVLALAPEENERILDLCAAPGGKSSHIAALMKNTGVLFVNDSNKDRLHAVLGNFHRLGIQNAVVTNMDGIKFCDVMKGFDRVLLDAPCTGAGVISKDPSVKSGKTEIDVQRCYNLQRRLLLSAIDCLSANSNTGGYLVYSTCSVLPQENEWVIDFALKRRNVRLVPTGIDFGVEGLTKFGEQRYHPSMKLTRRFYPHTHNLDGFFVAKLHKFSDAIPKSAADEPEDGLEDEEAEDEDKLPKKINKRDWYYKDIVEKRKAEREDKNHVVKVFQMPTNTKTKKKVKKNKESDPKTKSSTGEEQNNKSENCEANNSASTKQSKMNDNKRALLTKAERKEAEETLLLKQKMKQLKQKIANGGKSSNSPTGSTGGNKGKNANAKKSTGQNEVNGKKIAKESNQSNGKPGKGVQKNTLKKKVGKVTKAK